MNHLAESVFSFIRGTTPQSADNSRLPLVDCDGVPTVDSRVVAVHCNVQHESLYRLLLEHQAVIEEAFGTVRFQIGLYGTANGGGGKAPSFALLTEQQATVLITFTRNTDPVIKFKVALVEAFDRAKKMLRGEKGVIKTDTLGRLTEIDPLENPAVKEQLALFNKYREQGACPDTALTVASDMVRSSAYREGKLQAAGVPAQGPRFCEVDILNELSVLTGSKTTAVFRRMKSEHGMTKSTFYRLWGKLKAGRRIEKRDGLYSRSQTKREARP